MDYVMKFICLCLVIALAFAGPYFISKRFIEELNNTPEHISAAKTEPDNNKTPTITKAKTRIVNDTSVAKLNENRHALCGPGHSSPRTKTTVYKWHDENGKLHLSDRPPIDAPYTESEHKLSWADGLFELSINIANPEITPVPPYFKDRLKTNGQSIARSLAQIGNLKEPQPVRLDYTVYANRADYERERGKKGSTGVYNPATGSGAMIAQENGEKTSRVALHEITHAINCNMFGVMPSWLNEGLAEYFETIQTMDAYATVTADKHSFNMARQKAITGYSELIETIHQNSGSFWAMRDRAYPLSGSFVFFMLDSDQRRNILGQYLNALAKRQGAERFREPPASEFRALLDTHYPGGRDGAFRQWRMWVINNHLPAHTWRW